MIGLDAFSVRNSASKSVMDAIRRRIWRIFFEPRQRTLGTFFLDPCDHIGRERLVMGDRYEANCLEAIGRLIVALKLGQGLALDAGANIGNHACWFASWFAHVVCVEPGKVASLVLEANLVLTRQTNWEVFRCALGDRQGRGNLHIVRNDNLGSSQVTITSEGVGEFPVICGDNILTECAHPELPLTFIKIDVEGDELAVLSGLRTAIEKHKPLICVEALDETRWMGIKAMLSERGYSRFMALRPVDLYHNAIARSFSLIRGKRWRMAAVTKNFPPGGYEMIFCLTQTHWDRLGWRAGLSLTNLNGARPLAASGLPSAFRPPT